VLRSVSNTVYGPNCVVYPCNKVTVHEHVHGHLMLADQLIPSCEPQAFQLGPPDWDDSVS
jgi:hypothetical protein